MFITSKNKYLSNDMNIFGTCSIPLRVIVITAMRSNTKSSLFHASTHQCFEYLGRPPLTIAGGTIQIQDMTGGRRANTNPITFPTGECQAH